MQIKENIKAPRYWPLWGKSTGDQWFPSHRVLNTETVSIWWRHHAITENETYLTFILLTKQNFKNKHGAIMLTSYPASFNGNVAVPGIVTVQGTTKISLKLSPGQNVEYIYIYIYILMWCVPVICNMYNLPSFMNLSFCVSKHSFAVFNIPYGSNWHY